ncbi:hypothetical protein PSEUBRA_005100 [Kalmanozyma brasiliensis GHG001]|uniref:uncharacterized protein n=1 Tax=Kalmanozyma brasiliensis (strain GHG001) TaxID=1365824 RepID=UPI002867F783|nr:uncharacterized protein PSEUBRA_005100 [Kalmanozyma brasiliensis GHG001]KAF6767478.1 hypothetical protein PSEUBRA_005100 [Kalmanozyma brasiliensis GHG001]
MDEEANLQLHPATLDTGHGATTPSVPKPQPTSSVAGAIPMTMPSILRNGSSQANHLSYLLHPRASSSSYPPSRNTRTRLPAKEPQQGRRKQRRSENARLLANPHAVRPTIKDYRLHSNEIRSTFPATVAKKELNLPVPSSSRVGYSEPTHDAKGANEGHFGSSLKDAQRVLRRLEVGGVDRMVRDGTAGELERFIWLVEREIRVWSEGEVHVFSPSTSDRKEGRVLLDTAFDFTTPPFDGGSAGEVPVVSLDTIKSGQGGQLIEFQRTPNALVWLVHDPFLRLIVHCLARVSKCPSFSKDDLSRPGLRFTWVLNRNPLSRRSRRGRRVSVSSSTVDVVPPPRPVLGLGALETPPTTDFDSQTESEVGVDTDAESLGGSMVIVPPSEESLEADTERMLSLEDRGEEAVDTDEEEAEILRRVRRWAIDSHRQRKERQEGESREASPLGVRESRSTRGKTSRSDAIDPDATLTADAIAEEDSEEEDEDEVLSLSDG